MKHQKLAILPPSICTKLVKNALVVNVSHTYSELCDILQQPRYGGTQKEAQLKEFALYFKYEKIKINGITRYKILEIYKRKKNRPVSYPANTKYVEYVEQLIMQKLLNCRTSGILIGSGQLWIELGFIKPEYLKYRYIPTKLETDYDYPIEEIEKFYKLCNTSIPNILNRALSSMQQRFLINYTKKQMISYRDPITSEVLRREASKEDIIYIMKVKSKVLEMYGLSKEKEIFLANLYLFFYKKVNEICKIEKQWESVYEVYEILINKPGIMKKFKYDEIDNLRKTINSRFLIRLQETNANSNNPIAADIFDKLLINLIDISTENQKRLIEDRYYINLPYIGFNKEKLQRQEVKIKKAQNKDEGEDNV